jgi:putative SOS response-associated peptidase YedK
MCGRYASTLSLDLMARTLSAIVGTPTNLEPNWNVAPTQPDAVVRRHPNAGIRQIDILKWGLVPNWTKGAENRPEADKRPRRDSRHLWYVSWRLHLSTLPRAG